MRSRATRRELLHEADAWVVLSYVSRASELSSERYSSLDGTASELATGLDAMLTHRKRAGKGAAERCERAAPRVTTSARVGRRGRCAREHLHGAARARRADARAS